MKQSVQPQHSCSLNLTKRLNQLLRSECHTNWELLIGTVVVIGAFKKVHFEEGCCLLILCIGKKISKNVTFPCLSVRL